MFIPLPLHLLIHLILACSVGYLIGLRFNKIWLGVLAGISGGFFIDLDHILEYFLVYGPHFNLVYFLEGRQFLSSDKIHIWFHGWEYGLILLGLARLLRRKKYIYVFLIALTFGGLVHLATDCLINQYPPQNYSVLYRYQQGFAAQKLLSPAQYQKYIRDRQYFGM